jgi:hypothetical protein
MSSSPPSRDYLHPNTATDDVGAVLDRFDRTDVETDRCVELERLAARGRLRRVVDDDAVDEVVVRSFDF